MNRTHCGVLFKIIIIERSLSDIVNFNNSFICWYLVCIINLLSKVGYIKYSMRKTVWKFRLSHTSLILEFLLAVSCLYRINLRCIVTKRTIDIYNFRFSVFLCRYVIELNDKWHEFIISALFVRLNQYVVYLFWHVRKIVVNKSIYDI